ncbi:ABC transporter substrate-binding protein [Rhodococcus sp. HNM0563]|uniref:ABC transporter substrate-binding protein n=1 Tax=Rhodococcus sp. HNM0563 TaxID=2716339 RepID=UPI00146D8703|nr:ABC transporter substrate-binding protein [Rhodococcus sp. HNM0563]NLU61437.1 ABC transporter substrate-binding protein [Rhodococcus sp. HNM0563]
MNHHHFPSRIRALVVALSVTTMLLTACGTDDDASACGAETTASGAGSGLPDSLNVGVANNVAMAAPLTGLDDLGVEETSTSTASTPEELRTNFIAGNYDLAAMPINIAANLCAQGIDLVLVGTVSGNIVYLMGPEGTTLDDLRGQTVHIPFENDIIDLVTRQILDSAGMTYTGENPDVTLQYHPTPLDIATGLTSGSMQYAILPEHLSTVVAGAGGNIVEAQSMQDLWVEQTDASSLPFAGFVLRGEVAREYPDLVGSLQTNLLGSVIEVVSDPQRGAIAIADIVPIPVDVVGQVLPDLRPTYLPAAEGRTDTELLYESLMTTVPESIGGEMPADGFYGGN